MTDASSDTNHQVRVLNGLIETLIDSIDGYRTAAGQARSPSFRTAFEERAREREPIVDLLRERVRLLGGTPEEGGSLLASAHRAFLALRDIAGGGDDVSVIAEVDHGESYLKGRFDAALNDGRLAPEIHELVRNCYDNVRRGYEEWRQAHRDLAATGISSGPAFEIAGAGTGSVRTSS